jgi:uncharacterized protein (DUF4415 family)
MARRKHDPDQAPELGDDFFARAQPVADGPRALHEALREADAQRRRRGKQKAPTKTLVSLRLSAEVLTAYRATGQGWQSKINDDLVRASRRLPRAAAKPAAKGKTTRGPRPTP